MELSVQDTNESWRRLNCLATELSLPEQTVSDDDLEEFGLEADLKAMYGVQPAILIGLNNGHLSRVTDCELSHYEGIGAVKTVLGWALEGNVSNRATTTSGVVCLSHSVSMEKMVRDYINLDTFGLGDSEGQSRSIQDEQAI